MANVCSQCVSLKEELPNPEVDLWTKAGVRFPLMPCKDLDQRLGKVLKRGISKDLDQRSDKGQSKDLDLKELQELYEF